MKSVRVFVIISLLLFVTGSYFKVSADVTEISDFSYLVLSDDTVVITGYSGTADDVIVPAEIDGYPVIRIGMSAFEETKIKSIVLPEGLQEIGNNAFKSCWYLYKIYIPDSVTEFGADIFWYWVTANRAVIDFCPKVIIGEPGSCAEEYAKSNNIPFCYTNEHSNLVYDAAIEPTNEHDGRSAGIRCTECGAIISGYKVVSYTLGAIPKITVSTTEESTTAETTPKKGSTITKSGYSYKITASGTNSTVELSGTTKSKKSITIPATVTVNGVKYKVTSIGKGAFKNNTKITKVTIGSNVTKIGVKVFKGCKKLKKITIKSKNLTIVGNNAFKGINAKAKIKVPAKKIKAYKKLFKDNGLKATVKIIK